MPVNLDVLIFGGGVAGLWLLDVLRRAGHRVLLLEADRLGAGQTACSQGIIHGGLKYALDGVLSPSASSISEMPEFWRQCLSGRRQPDLSATRVRAERCYLWRTGSLRSRVGMLGARLALRATPHAVAGAERPPVLARSAGTVATVDEPVIDPVSLVADLAGRHRDWILSIDAATGLELSASGPVIEVADEQAGRMTIRPRAVVLAAGAGNGGLIDRLGLAPPVAHQRRPLHMLMMRGDRLPVLNGHCVDGARTRVTITADSDSAGRVVWQVGGQLAEDGVAMDEPDLLARGAAEIRAVLPDLDLGGVEWASYRVDRAEGAASGRRPHDSTVERRGDVIVAWPTKLALAPRLADRIRGMLDAPAQDTDGLDTASWPRPSIAQAPWETQQQWFRDL